jgi:hypothetical protein
VEILSACQAPGQYRLDVKGAYIIPIHWIHRHSSWWFISTHPADTGPSPVPPGAAKENIDIGSPRLSKVPLESEQPA